MLGYIMFFAVVLFSLSMGIYEYQEAHSWHSRVLSIIALTLTVIIATAVFVVCVLIEKGVIML